MEKLRLSCERIVRPLQRFFKGLDPTTTPEQLARLKKEAEERKITAALAEQEKALRWIVAAHRLELLGQANPYLEKRREEAIADVLGMAVNGSGDIVVAYWNAVAREEYIPNIPGVERLPEPVREEAGNIVCKILEREPSLAGLKR